MTWFTFSNWFKGILNTSMGFLAGFAIGLVSGMVGLGTAFTAPPQWATSIIFLSLSIGAGALIFKYVGYQWEDKENAIQKD